MIVDVIAGARPNFIKVAALHVVAGEFPSLTLRLVHTGQHYDATMSDVFLKELGLPEPVCNLGVGSGTHAAQTAEIIKRYGGWIAANRPDACIVVGDVNSTLACALVAAKEGIRVGHVEAGLRSFDRTMPEEINRTLTDAISDWMFVSEPSGAANLKREGRPEKAVHWVGNVMIDTLRRMQRRAEALQYRKQFGVAAKGYAYMTLHRPSNVDDDGSLGGILEQVLWLARRMPVIFPVHPRTRKKLEGFSARLAGESGLRLAEPMGYVESLSLLSEAKLVVTDSGGIQEETTALGVPCLTLRENTERPITVEEGTNTLIGRDWELFRECVERVEGGTYARRGASIRFWDGQTGRRILGIMA